MSKSFLRFNRFQKDNDKEHKVRLAIGNGIRAEVWREFLNRFGNIQIREFYASTEGNVGFVNYAGKIGAVGRVNFFYRVRLKKKHSFALNSALLTLSRFKASFGILFIELFKGSFSFTCLQLFYNCYTGLILYSRLFKNFSFPNLLC